MSVKKVGDKNSLSNGKKQINNSNPFGKKNSKKGWEKQTNNNSGKTKNPKQVGKGTKSKTSQKDVERVYSTYDDQYMRAMEWYNNTEQSLKNERDEALRKGDIIRVESIEDELSFIKNQKKKLDRMLKEAGNKITDMGKELSIEEKS